MFLYGLVAGLLFEFLLNRFCDSMSRRDARRVDYNCDKCQYHCTGFHCWNMRKEIAADTIEGGEDELSELRGSDTD